MFISIKVLGFLNRIHFEGGGGRQPVLEYGCYRCGKVYLVADHPITDWLYDQTATCPVCKWNTVIPKLSHIGCNFTDHDMRILGKQEFGRSEFAKQVTIGKTNVPVFG